MPLAEGVVYSLGDIAGGEVLGAGFGEEAVELFGDGPTAGAADEFTAGCGGTCLAGLFFDVVDALDVKEDGQGDFGASVPEVGKFAPSVGKAASVAEAVLGGDGLVDDVAVCLDVALVGDGVGLLVVAEEA